MRQFPEFQNETVVTVRAGDAVELGCDVIVDPVLTEVGSVRRFWEKDGKILVRMIQKGTLSEREGSVQLTSSLR